MAKHWGPAKKSVHDHSGGYAPIDGQLPKLKDGSYISVRGENGRAILKASISGPGLSFVNIDRENGYQLLSDPRDLGFGEYKQAGTLPVKTDIEPGRRARVYFGDGEHDWFTLKVLSNDGRSVQLADWLYVLDESDLRPLKQAVKEGKLRIEDYDASSP